MQAGYLQGCNFMTFKDNIAANYILLLLLLSLTYRPAAIFHPDQNEKFQQEAGKL